MAEALPSDEIADPVREAKIKAISERDEDLALLIYDTLLEGEADSTNIMQLAYEHVVERARLAAQDEYMELMNYKEDRNEKLGFSEELHDGGKSFMLHV